MPPQLGESRRAAKDGLSVRAYPGAGMVLLAFDLPRRQVEGLAGFAVHRTSPDGKAAYLPNRLRFAKEVTASTKPEQRTWTPSDKAPFQKFRWVDFPRDVQAGAYAYEVTAMYFGPAARLERGPSVGLALPIRPEPYGNFEVGFTRGYLSSQAYRDRWGQKPYRPQERTIDYDTTPYRAQYEWLGFTARRLLFDFLAEARDDPRASLDVFAYDLDEPDVVQHLAKMGDRLRAYLDDSPEHVKATALERQARATLEATAGPGRVRTGHFGRFAHCKMLILKRDGVPRKVLTGSANFSVRGLYVQANNVLVFDDPAVAAHFEACFEQAFNAPRSFKDSASAAGWTAFHGPGLPRTEVSFAPHRTASVSLDEVAEAIAGAKGSVLFAVMQLGGSGPVLEALRGVTGQDRLFSYGVTQTKEGLNFFKPGKSRGRILPFAFLDKKVPAPFGREWRGGPGQVVHHKFVVVDFNGRKPVVFTGSSNLAAGGETKNNDNLLALRDRHVAGAFAVEAVRLFDHYHFRVAMLEATKAEPLVLQPAGADRPWWAPYYDKDHIKSTDRRVFG